MGGREPRVLITDEDVRIWRDELARLELEVRGRQERILALRRKLDAVAVLFPEYAIEQISEQPPVSGKPYEADASNSLPNGIAYLLELKQVPLNSAEIREGLSEIGLAERLRENPNYLYTVISRMTQKGTLIRVGKKYSLPNGASSAEEAGADEPRHFNLEAQMSLNGGSDDPAEVGGT